MTKRRPPKAERDPPWLRAAKTPTGGESGKKPPDRGDDDEALWRKIAESVKPLAESKHKRHAAATPLPVPKPAPTTPEPPGATSTRSSDRAAPRPPVPKPAPVPPPLVPGTLAGLDRRTGERLRKGRMPVDAKLDLHGMTQQQAHGAVTRFVAAQQAAGARCVLIVTGKGGRRDDLFSPKAAPAPFTFSPDRGVLKDALPRWLNEPALRPYIVAVTQAQPGHGGGGAVYVLLKRKR